MHIQNYLATLEFVNEERASLGLAPLDHLPKGRPGNPTDCVIARAIPGATVPGTEVRFEDGRRIRMPSGARAFVSSFDMQGFSALRLAHVSVFQDTCDPGTLVDGGIDDDKGCLVPA